MPATFGDVWRAVRLHAPGVPALLVQNWVQSTYATLTDSRPWSWSLQPIQLAWADAIDLAAVVVTRGSTAVTSTALFTSAMAGRQFRVGTFPIYTVQSVASTSAITLDQPYYGEEDGTQEAQIVDAYATMPATFGAFTALVDPVNQHWVPWWMTMDELDLLDPTRTSAANSPRVLANGSLSTYVPMLNRPQYQYWPIPTAAGALQGYMRTRPAELADQTPLQGVLAHRSDVLEQGALAECARWPGTQDKPNPYFNLNLARELQQGFERLVNQLDNRDDDLYRQNVDWVPWQKWGSYGWAYDTHYLQQTDATLGAYFGMGGYPGWGY